MLGMLSVLIVEDMDIIARRLAAYVSENRWLKVAGMAATEQDAIDMARRARPDLVLLDIGLSTPMGGFDVWRALRELDKEPYVIAVTAAGDMSTVVKAQKYGAFSYVVKPFARATIEAKLADYIAFRRLVDAAPPRARQAEIEIFWRTRCRPCSPPPGLLPETADLIIRVLWEADRPLRASEIADRAQVERATANKYLKDYLCDQGIAIRVPEHGRPGHPAFLYTLAPGWNPESD